MPEESIAQQQARLLQEHKFQPISIDGVEVVRMRRFNSEEGLDVHLWEDLMKVADLLTKKGPGLRAVMTAGSFDGRLVMDVLAPALPIIHKRLQQCIDRPLSAVDFDCMPALLGGMIALNFTARLLKSLGGLRQMVPAIGNMPGPGTSETPSSSSSTTVTAGGASTPATSSNSGSGGA